MKKLSFLALLLIAGIFTSCKDENDIIPDDNEPVVTIGTIVSTVPMTGMYDITASGQYAYAGLNQGGIGVINISNPSSAVLVNTLHPVGEIRKVMVQNNVLYAAAYDEGLYAYSLTDPANPTEILHFVPADEISNVYTNDQYIFAAGGISSNGYLGIHDKTTGNLIGSFSNSASDETDRGFQSICVSDNTLYAGTNGGYLYIIDISNPASPVQLSRYYHPGTAGHSPWLRGITVSGSTVFLSDWGAGFIAVDASIPTSPALLQAFTSGTDGPEAYDAEIVGNTAYVANGWGGMLVINISNPTNMQLLYEVNPTMTSYLGVSIWGNYALLADNGQQMLSVVKIQ